MIVLWENASWCSTFVNLYKKDAQQESGQIHPWAVAAAERERLRRGEAGKTKDR